MELLVSVQNLDEALLAADCGVRWIDVKRPHSGSLGAADEATLKSIARRLAKTHCLSAALGEWHEPCRITSDALVGYQFVKRGLSRMIRRQRASLADANWTELAASLPPSLPDGVRRVLVAYADAHGCGAPPPRQVVAAAVAAARHGTGGSQRFENHAPQIDHGAAGGHQQNRETPTGAVLFDTFDKSSGGLFDHLHAKVLRDLVAQAHAGRLLVVLAGSLTLNWLPLLADLAPDVIAVRGAVTHGDRRSSLCKRRIGDWLRAIQPHRKGLPVPAPIC